jgi:hypothetical protein
MFDELTILLVTAGILVFFLIRAVSKGEQAPRSARKRGVIDRDLFPGERREDEQHRIDL